MEEKRNLNVIIGKSGGNAGPNSLNYKINIPSKIAKDMGITQEDKKVQLIYNKETKIITLKKEETDD